MAPGHLLLISLHIPILTILLLLSTTANCTCFTRIFCFGDSISNTGNYLKSIGDGYHPICSLPYGETYFGGPTGWFSDGQLILDFIEAYGLPFVPPYLSGMSTKDLLHGANFAVGGAIALNNSFFESKGIEMSRTDYSLGTQLEWFKKLLPSILEEPEIVITPKAGKGACSRAIEGETELRRAPEDEFFESNPLDANQTEQADYFCGIKQGMLEIEEQRVGEEKRTDEEENEEGEDDKEEEESVLGGINFDSDEEFTEEEGDEGSASK